MTIQAMIDDLVRLGQTTVGTSDVLSRCLTFNQRVPLKAALSALSHFERCIAEYLLGGGQDPDTHTAELALVMRPHGQCRIVNIADYHQHRVHLRLVRQFSVPSFVHFEAGARTLFAQNHWTMWASDLRQSVTQGELMDAARALQDGITHMAPLVLHVERQCFSNFYYVGTDEFVWETTLHTALEAVIQQGHDAPMDCVVLTRCMHLLWRSGGYTRLEEFNGRQLTPLSLQAWFLKRFGDYQASSQGEEQDFDAFVALSPESQADALAQMRSRLMEQGQFVREINGLNLSKQERYLPHWLLGDELRRITLRAQSHALIQEALGVDVSASEFFDNQALSNLIHHRRLRSASSPFASDLEFLIDALLKRVVEVTGSDFSMSRGVRSFQAFVHALREGQHAELCDWSQAEYFCHVVPSAGARAHLAPRTLQGVLNAVSARMRYNSWHYTPSHVPSGAVPENRSWFFAPKMADTTVWSDQHHAGHVHATVRYCIRSPYALTMGGTPLPGFVDLRLFRQHGEPYSARDLGTALAYTEALGVLYQRLMNHVLATQDPFSFEFGSKAWIDRQFQTDADALEVQS